MLRRKDTRRMMRGQPRKPRQAVTLPWHEQRKRRAARVWRARKSTGG